MEKKDIIANRIATLKKLRDRSVSQVRVEAYDVEIEALTKEMEKPAKKKAKAKEEGDDK